MDMLTVYCVMYVCVELVIHVKNEASNYLARRTDMVMPKFIFCLVAIELAAPLIGSIAQD